MAGLWIMSVESGLASLWIVSVESDLTSSSVSAGDGDALQLVHLSPYVLGCALALVELAVHVATDVLHVVVHHRQSEAH